MSRSPDKLGINKPRSRRQAQVATLTSIPQSSGVLGLVPEVSALLPCVIYQADLSLRLSYISENICELVGLEGRALDGRDFWTEYVFPDDHALFLRKREEFQLSAAVAFLHRILDARKLPVWVSHRMKKARIHSSDVVLGTLVALEGDPRIPTQDPNVSSRFVHKIGNQFQLLNLIANSLTQIIPDGREIEILQGTIDRAIELVRAFSNYNQLPTWLPHTELSEVIKGAIAGQSAFFRQKGVFLKERLGESLDEASVAGDPLLLEAGIGHILQNALEATDSGGIVSVLADVETYPGHASVAKIKIADDGCGIESSNLPMVTVPFFTAKKDRDGLGLTLASRFIEMHGGLLKIRSSVGAGTEVEISLPVVSSRKEAL